MVIEEFLDGSPEAVYARLAEKGRMIPEGVEYVESWVTEDLTHCYQVMRCQDAAQLDEWMQRWSDLVLFRVTPVIESREAAGRYQPPRSHGTQA